MYKQSRKLTANQIQLLIGVAACAPRAATIYGHPWSHRARDAAFAGWLVCMGDPRYSKYIVSAEGWIKLIRSVEFQRLQAALSVVRAVAMRHSYTMGPIELELDLKLSVGNSAI